MADPANVIHLQPEVQRHVRARLSRLSKHAVAVQTRTKKLISIRFVKLFDVIDDAMFKLADGASSNEDQNLYFDSMREVRVQRQAIEKRFLEMVDESFARLICDDERDVLGQSGELSSDALSLIQNDDLEQLVAIETVNKRANRRFEPSIKALSKALSGVVPVQVTSANLPIGPDLLNKAFLAQIRRLDIDIKAKLALFDVFERVMIASVGVFCKHIWGVLQETGLQITSLETKQREFTAPRGTSQQGGAKLTSVDSKSALIELLNFVQKLPVSTNGGQEIDIRKLLDGVQKRRGVHIDIGKVESETIRLVQMLFEFVLKDRSLALTMRELICHLQIPILKVALLDDKFLADKQHPARRLLNDIAAAAIGWQPNKHEKSEHEPLLKVVTGIMDRVVRDFDRDISIFNTLLVEFRSFRDKEQKRTSAMEKRTVDAEDGKAKAELARKTVAAEIDLRTMAYSFPFVVRELIFGPWSNVLFVTALKYGLASIEWAEALKVMTDLIHSVQPCQSRNERQKLVRMAPDVVKRIRKGLDSIAFNPFEVSEMISALEDVHTMLIRGEEVECHERKSKVATKLASSGQADKPAIQEKGSELELSADDPFMLAVSGFSPGAWYDLKNGNDEPLRCRLVAFIKVTGKYIFVNRTGAKVAEHTQIELALKLKVGEVKPVDNGMLFDKALENVVSSLRESKNKNNMDLSNRQS